MGLMWISNDYELSRLKFGHCIVSLNQPIQILYKYPTLLSQRIKNLFLTPSGGSGSKPVGHYPYGTILTFT